MTRRLASGLAVLVPLVAVAGASSAGEPGQWLSPAGGFAYCSHTSYPGSLYCFSPISGKWIRIDRLYEGKYVKVREGNDSYWAWDSHRRTTTGTNPRLVTYRRTRGVDIIPNNHTRGYEERGGSFKCSTTRRFFRCWVMGDVFSFKRDGAFRLVRNRVQRYR